MNPANLPFDQTVLERLVRDHSQYSHFIFDIDQMKADIQETKKSLSQIGLEKIYYSVKANPQPSLIQEILNLADGFDISSKAEMDLLLKMRISPERMSFSGPAKTLQGLDTALAKKISVIHIDSVDEFEKIIRHSQFSKKETQLTLRLPVPEIGGDKLGFSDHDLQLLFKTLRKHNNFPQVLFSGFHFYLGRERFSEKLLHDVIQKSELVLNSFRDFFSKSPELYIGLGLPAFKICSHKKLLSIKPLTSKQFKINCEMGRGLIHSSGYYLAKVLSVKKVEDRRILTLSGGLQHMASYFGSLNYNLEDVELTYLNSQGELLEFDGSEPPLDEITGSLSLWHDRIIQQQKIPRSIKRNCWVLMNPTGTYGWTSAVSQFLGTSTVREWKLENKNKLTEVTPQFFKSYHQSFYEDFRS